MDKDISDVASGLKWNQDQVDAVAPKYHKGGKIKKDGEQVVNGEKGETVLPKKGNKRATELAMKHLDGMKDGMGTRGQEARKADEKEAWQSEEDSRSRQ